jgi:hypothetical protein
MDTLKKAYDPSFEELGLEVAHGEVEVGQTYPIFGMITRLINDTPGSVVAEINYNIVAKMNIPDTAKLELLRERAFEAGIFVSTVTAKEPTVRVDCKTIVFGRKQAYHA